MTRWQDALYQQGWNSLYLNNHDQPRPVSRFGDDGRHRVASAKMLATFLHGMQGTPYVYQGEELGMTNVAFASIEDYQDIEIRNMYRVATEERGMDPAEVMASIHAKGRDNARTPMPWDTSANAGFTTGTPWLKLNPNHPQINAAQAVADPASVFQYYRRLIAMRRVHPVLVHGRYALLVPDHPQLYAYTRTLSKGAGEPAECWLVVCNFSGDTPVFDLPADVPASGCDWMLGNYPPCEGDALHGSPLRPWEARMLRLHA
jgi:oligo-1,6-glucosidase